MISSAKQNGTIKTWKLLQGDIENKNKVTLLVGNYKTPMRGI